MLGVLTSLSAMPAWMLDYLPACVLVVLITKAPFPPALFLSNLQVRPRNAPVDQYQPEPVAYGWSKCNIAACTGQHYVETAAGESECWAFSQGSLSYYYRLPACVYSLLQLPRLLFACVVSVDVHGHRVRNGACGNCVYAHRDGEGSHPMDTGKFLVRFIVY